MSARRVVLLRHGRSTSNAEGRFQGHHDVHLDEVGHAQAAAAAAVLAELLAAEASRDAVRVVSSDLARAVETAEPVVKALGVDLATDPALRERDAGNWQGLLRAEIAERFPDEFAAWTAGRDVAIGGGELLAQCWGRAEAAIRRHAESMDPAPDGAAQGALVVVGHGTSMRGGMMRLVGLLDGGPDDPVRYRMLGGFGNCHWAEVRASGSGAGSGWVLARFNVPLPASDGASA